MTTGKKTKISAIIFLAVLFGQAVCFSPALAQANPNLTLSNPLNADSLDELVSAIAEWLYLIMIPIAAIIFLYAGAMFMFSGGDEDKIKKAKRALFWGVIGVGIIIVGRGIVETIKSFLETGSSGPPVFRV
jgi:hypothetical protein